VLLNHETCGIGIAVYFANKPQKAIAKFYGFVTITAADFGE
jgi:hypothetical protein